MTAVAVLAAMLCVWFLVPAVGPGLRRLAPRPIRTRTLDVWRVCLVAWIACGAAGVALPPAAVVAVVGMVGTTAAWVVVSHIADRRARRASMEVVRTAQVLESLLALGHIPSVALTLTAQECPVVAPAVAHLKMGGDPWEVMDDMARTRGFEGLGRIARVWRVSYVTGASMHEGLGVVRQSLEDAADTAVVVAGELAGPRATGRLLCLLPLVGLGMAVSLGANPLHFFTASWGGRLCLLIGAGLGCLGLVWSEHLASQATGGARSNGKGG